MKKLLSLFAPLLILVAIVCAPAGQVAAESATDPFTRVSNTVGDIYTSLNESADTPNETFFPAFAEKAVAARAEISQAYTDLGDITAYDGAATALDDIRHSLIDMRQHLAAWEESARNNDAESFDAVSADFGATVDDYNQAVDAYNAAAAAPLFTSHVDLTYLIPGILMLATAIAGIVVRKKRLGSGKNNKLVVSPRTFLLLNLTTGGLYYIYWAWQAWQTVARVEKKKYHTIIRALFINLTAFSLFRKLQDLAQGTGYKRTFRHQLLAVGLLLEGITFAPLSYRSTGLTFAAVTIADAVLITALATPVIRAYNHFATNTKAKLLPQGRTWPLFTFAIVLALLLILGAFIPE